ncbi:DUF4145 domain-containing protein [Bradyrhizobium symbiodeficiens]|uniref:DUF4145 domain-containing protein n=1 Tax=Bradyrhizobium symbiodeficiens TaxID=1404367 RepID=A0A6G9A0L3_9BRAD|nr:DUF4145 domain-containing protein [Bradyrhizobium symbiodeficiens]QIP05753.1 DUF4145 domain-containing protein [Bradyrhizobium symbiodeficiens]
MAHVGGNWNCPYCGHAQVIADERFSKDWYKQYVRGWKKEGYQPAMLIQAIVCANQACRELTLAAALGLITDGKNPRDETPKALQEWRLLPQSSAKPQPDAVPDPLRLDYYEACAIRDLSPKASATLIRRCLQGMIRDFCGIAKATLAKEIEGLREALDNNTAPKGVTHESVDAIEAVKKVGNIGAHMEKDIDLIVDVDPGEAQILIELAEMLFNEWYVERQARTKRLARITALSTQKASDIAQAKIEKEQQKVLPPSSAKQP